MAHVKKFAKAACGQMFSHYDRKKENIGNEEIDKAKSHLNYNLALHQQQQQGDFIRKRCSEIKVQNRKDVNVMCSWVVTAPKDLPSADEKKFFQDSYDFLKKRYGEENIISAYVHNDEKTPHLHYAFVPVVTDKKKGGHKLSAKECITRKDLQTFHHDLSSHLEKTFGHEIRVINEATKDGNKTIQQLKTKTALEQLAKIEETTINIENDMQIKVENLGVQAHELKSDIELLKSQKVNAKGEIQALGTEFKGKVISIDELKKLNPQKTLTGAIKGISIEDIQNLIKTAYNRVDLSYKYRDLINENEKLKKQVPSIREKLKQTEDLISLENKLNNANSQIDRIVEVFEEFPKIYKAFLKAEEMLYKQQQQNRNRGMDMGR